MPDSDWRAIERAWEADPGDQESLGAYVRARRRAGFPVTSDLLERRVFPPRRFDSHHRLRVDVQDEAGRQHLVGVTPSLGSLGLSIPEHRAWSIEAAPTSDEDLRSLCQSLAPQRVFGLDLSAGGVRTLRKACPRCWIVD